MTTRVIRLAENDQEILETLDEWADRGWHVRQMVPTAWDTDGGVRYVSVYFVVLEA